VHHLDNKVFDIIDARCNHEVLTFVYAHFYKNSIPTLATIQPSSIQHPRGTECRSARALKLRIPFSRSNPINTPHRQRYVTLATESVVK